MKAYIGQTRSASWIRTLSSYGFGECVSRGEFPPRRLPWFLDNGAFGDWRALRPFAVDKYERDLSRLRASDLVPDFLVVPDLVAQGMESLRFSLSWLDRLPAIAPRYLVLQDGMSEEIARELQAFDGLFVGGTLSWKLRTGADWVTFAHRHQLPCHIGRVGTFKRVRWARRIGADSIDSSLPLWSVQKFQTFLRAFADEPQQTLF